MTAPRDTGVALTTTPSFEGRGITRYAGIVASEVIVVSGPIENLKAGIFTMFGGRSGVEENLLAKAREQVLLDLCKQASDKKANAVVGLRVDCVSFRNEILVTATGTAVVIV